MDSLLLIDTDILIDVGRKNNIAIDRLDIARTKSITAISSITEMELIVGCRNKN